MSSNATTRSTRVALGLCAVCLRRRATAGRPTCKPCRERIADGNRTAYAAARKLGLCTRHGCSEPAPISATSGKPECLCATHSAARRKARAS